MEGSKPLFDLRLFAPDLRLTSSFEEFCQVLQHLFLGVKPWVFLRAEHCCWYFTGDIVGTALLNQIDTLAQGPAGALSVELTAQNWYANGFRQVTAHWQLTVWLRQPEALALSLEQRLSLEQLALSIGLVTEQEFPSWWFVRGCWITALPWQQGDWLTQPLWLTRQNSRWLTMPSRDAEVSSRWPAEAEDWLETLLAGPSLQGRILHPNKEQLCQLTLVTVEPNLHLLCWQNLSVALRLRWQSQELALYQGALNSGLAGLIALDQQDFPVFINPKARELLQLPALTADSGALNFDHLRFYDMQEDMPCQVQVFSFLRKYQSEKQCQCLVQYQDGTSRILEFLWAIRQDNRRHDILMYCLCTDITGQYQLRQALHHIEHHLDQLLDYSPVVLYQQFIDYKHGFTYISPNAKRLLGHSQKQLLAEPDLFLSLVHPDDLVVIQQPECVSEYRLWSEIEQGYIWLKDIREPDPDTAGGIYGALTNITARKITELEKLRLINDLEEQKQLVTSTVNGLLDGVLTIDETGKILSCNPTVSRLLGFRREELLGRNVSSLMPQPDAGAHDGYLRRYMAGGEPRIVGIGRRVMAQHKDGQLIPVHLSVTELPKGKDNLRRFVGCLHDLTELERQQQQLVQSSKLSAIGTLTSGIAHDFNNILGIIRGYAELLVGTGEAVAVKPAQAIIKAADRASFMVKNLLEFSTNRQRESQLVEAGNLLNEITPMLTEACGGRITLHIDSPPRACWLELEKGGLENALLNLVINAKQAMEGSGRILCRCSVVKADSRWLGDIKPVAGEYLQIEVQDSGCGMTEQVKARIFEPFFSTKGAHGTGLGLAQVHGFIRRCHGVLQVDSTPGEGTTFHLYFPLMPALQQLTQGPQHKAKSSEKTLLLVDDETELLELHATMLELAGFHVLKASNGADALQILTTTVVSALISDVVMPGINGIELARRARELYPQLPVQLVSGFADESMANDDESREWYRQRLSKPLQTSKLVARVRHLTEAGD